MAPGNPIEKFGARELADLRGELLERGLDSWQASEVLSAFLAGRGYGVNRQLALDAVSRIEIEGCGLDFMQAELERVAMVM